MDLPKNPFKAALRAGERQIGLWHTFANPDVAELMATCGYDWILMDTEHSPAGPAEALAFLRTVAPYPVTGVVRPAWNDPVEIKKMLDVGAQTLLIPYVQTPEEARAAVAAVTYPPKGIRGVAGVTRATRYGSVEKYAERANEEICLLVQVETRSALEQIEEIASIEGVDGVFIGPADLAASFGYPGQPSHPEVKAAILDGFARLKKVGVPGGILSLDDGLLRDSAEAGAQFLAVEIDSTMIRKAALARRADWS